MTNVLPTRTACVYCTADAKMFRTFIAAHSVTLCPTPHAACYHLDANRISSRALSAQLEPTFRWWNCSRAYWLNVWSWSSFAMSIETTVHLLLSLEVGSDTAKRRQ